MLVGYARVSTAEQTLALQEDALRAAGCEKLFTDTMSGAQAERPGLAAALAYLRPGDALAVWRLDRLGRSLPALIATLHGLEGRGIGFRSLTEQLDTTTSGGKLIFHVFGALAEFERDLIRERTQAGLAAARVRGRQGGGRRSWARRRRWRWPGRCTTTSATRSPRSAGPSASRAPRSTATSPSSRRTRCRHREGGGHRCADRRRRATSTGPRSSPWRT